MSRHKVRWNKKVRLDAFVMLRDHPHAIWTFPLGDTDYSKPA